MVSFDDDNSGGHSRAVNHIWKNNSNYEWACAYAAYTYNKSQQQPNYRWRHFSLDEQQQKMVVVVVVVAAVVARVVTTI